MLKHRVDGWCVRIRVNACNRVHKHLYSVCLAFPSSSTSSHVTYVWYICGVFVSTGIHVCEYTYMSDTQVDFPGLGRLVTNRAGRVEFVFDNVFMEHFEREHYAVVKEVSACLRVYVIVCAFVLERGAAAQSQPANAEARHLFPANGGVQTAYIQKHSISKSPHKRH